MMRARSGLRTSDYRRANFPTFAICTRGSVNMQRVTLARAVSADHYFVCVACSFRSFGDDPESGTGPRRSPWPGWPSVALKTLWTDATRRSLGPWRSGWPDSSGCALWTWRSGRSRKALHPLRPLRPRRPGRPWRRFRAPRDGK